eukprot:scpid51146/ scgid23484/ 
MDIVQSTVHKLKAETKAFQCGRLKKLRELDLFVLDTSIRETTVGQLRGHTLEDKKVIFEEIKKCGLKNICVAAFADATRVDDDFCQYLKDSGEDMSNLYTFSELSDSVQNGRYNTVNVPVGCQKTKKYGIQNIVLEIELTQPEIGWNKTWTVSDQCQLLTKLFGWVRREISKYSRILVNFRDFSATMARCPERLLEVIQFLASMPSQERIFGLMYEDLGDGLPEELGLWTSSARRVMEACGWKDARLLMHVHEQWDLQTAATLECLSQGANGIWAALCEEGAPIGHASSTITALNLVRLGNKRVLNQYNVDEMRDAAIAVTKATTGRDPSPWQVVYGERALDHVIGFPMRFAREFDTAKFFGLEPANRMNTLASPEMIRAQLISVFGENKQFTTDMACAMKALMLEDLRAGRKEEYMTEVGLALLFDRAGGKLTKNFSRRIAKLEVTDKWQRHLIMEMKRIWDATGGLENYRGGSRMPFETFYKAFLSRFFNSFSSREAKQALQALDMDSNGFVDWNEFLVYIRWALTEYPDIGDTEELLDTAIKLGLTPAMKDEKVRDEKRRASIRGRSMVPRTPRRTPLPTPLRTPLPTPRVRAA